MEIISFGYTTEASLAKPVTRTRKRDYLLSMAADREPRELTENGPFSRKADLGRVNSG
jgi:hypothetical protein